MHKLTIFGVLFFLIHLSTVQAQPISEKNVCEYFYQTLKKLPHTELNLQNKEIRFPEGDKRYPGCKVTWSTNSISVISSDSISSYNFRPGQDTVLTQNGWRINKNYSSMTMHGGSSVERYGIAKADILCVINEHSNMSYEGGELEGTLDVTIECAVQ